MEGHIKDRNKYFDEDIMYLYQPRFEWVYKAVDDVLKHWSKKQKRRDCKVYPSTQAVSQVR
jgi:hypothetical protein